MSRVAVLASLLLVPACRIVLDENAATDASTGVDAFVSPACSRGEEPFRPRDGSRRTCSSRARSVPAITARSAAAAGRIDLRVGISSAFLVNFDSALDRHAEAGGPAMPARVIS